MLQAIDIRKKYGDNEILKGVTVRVDKGEVVAVIGRSGSGKSTLLRCLNHLETIDSGEIRIDGQAMVTTGADGAARYRTEKDLRGLCLKMGLVFQDYNLFPHYTVLRNIVAPQQLVLHRSRQEAEQKAMLLLEKVRRARIPAIFPAGSVSASPSPARWPWIRKFSALTSRPARLTRSSRRRCSASSVSWPPKSAR